jgi:predicted nuclease of predicted toxin-antitoxin system
MGIRFFADHCVPTSVIRLLSDAGHEVLKLREYIPQDSPDAVVISKARDLDSILISLNGDFVDIVTYPPGSYNGIIALQIRNHPQAVTDIVNRLIIYLSSHPDMGHYRGKLFLVEAHRIRIRD